MQSEATAPVILSPAEKFLRDTGHAWEREEDGTIYVSGLDLGKPNLDKYGKWPLKELPDLSSVVVEGDFRCSDNQLTSLKGCPQTVTGNFYCYNNLLESLDGSPEKVGGGFYCSMNLMKDLTGMPREVGGTVNCQSSPNLVNLKGAPEDVPGDFLCHEGVLESLEGGPKKVGGDMWVQKNKLRNIEHAPSEVGRFFQCHGNYIAHLEGAPEKFERIYSDLGDFTSLAEIPDEIRYSPETRARREEERLQAEAEKLDQSVREATVLSRPIAVRKTSLKLAK